MTASTDGASLAPTRGELRRELILKAAIEQFSLRGFQGTSMIHIAGAAGVSRPAVYQYFQNKDEVFAAAFVGLFESLVSGALEALDGPGTITGRLDGFLQRFEGDLWEQMSASPHVDEIIDAKNDQVAAAAAQVVSRLSESLSMFLDDIAPARSTADRGRQTITIDLLRLAPKGFRFDQPSVALFRRRLSALARSVAADLIAD